MLGCDDVGQERLPEGCLRILEIRLPKRAPLRHQRVFAGDAVHEYIEATTLAFHSLEKGLHLFLHCVIDAKCDGGAAGRADHFGCLFKSFRTIVRGAVGTHASSSAIDRRTGFSERPSDAAPRVAPATTAMAPASDFSPMTGRLREVDV
jgi:hypothetical protein